MRLISASEKLRMTQTATESFNDLCDIHSPTITQDSLGEQSKTWSTVSNVACGFAPNTPRKSYRGEIATLDCDAVLRLATSTSFDVNKEVTCKGNRYKVQGLQTGKTCAVATLKRVDVND